MVMTPEQTLKVVGHLMGSNNRVPQDAIVNAWHDTLKNLDYDLVVSAARKCKATMTELPNSAQFLAVCAEILTGPMPDENEALREVQQGINSWGRDNEPKWTHPAIAKAIEGIGWRNLCNKDADFWAIEFRKAYKISEGRYVREIQQTMLEGVNAAVALDTARKQALEKAKAGTPELEAGEAPDLEEVKRKNREIFRLGLGDAFDPDKGDDDGEAGVPALV